MLFLLGSKKIHILCPRLKIRSKNCWLYVISSLGSAYCLFLNVVQKKQQNKSNIKITNKQTNKVLSKFHRFKGVPAPLFQAPTSWPSLPPLPLKYLFPLPFSVPPSFKVFLTSSTVTFYQKSIFNLLNHYTNRLP